MAQAVRTTWSTNRHWLAAGFLASTGLFLLLMFVNWRNERRGIAAQRASGLASSAWEPASLWQQKSILPSFPHRQHAPTGVDYAYSTLGGVPGGVRPDSVDSRLESEVDNTDRQVIRSGTLEIIVTDPLQAAEQLRDLASQFSGFVVSSKVNGSDERTRSAQVTMRIPAKHLDEARAQVRAIAKAVEEDTIEARDVTREYVDQEAKLRNFRAEEAQYLAILKRATAVKDVLEVSSKLAEVLGRTDELEAGLRFLRHQVEMSLLTANITAMAEAQVFGIRWRPLYKAKLALRGALSAMVDYGDSMVELFLNFPVLAMWGFTIVALLKVGWIVLRRIVLLFFPGLATWMRRPVQSQAT
jgi:Domain of unknown function (DUF4349)